MSKAKQRRQSAFSEGRRDAIRGEPFRWEWHPHLESYRAGYQCGQEIRAARQSFMPPMRQLFGDVFAEIFGRKGGR